MRARYAAYVLEKIDFIEASHDPDKRHEMDKDGALEWAQSAEWLGLDVNATEGGGPDDDEGVVEFVAKYEVQERIVNHLSLIHI